MDISCIVAMAQVRAGAITARQIEQNPAWKGMVTELTKHGLVKMEPHMLVLKLTQRGRQYMHDLERVKLPKVKDNDQLSASA